MPHFHNIFDDAREKVESVGLDWDDVCEHYENFGYIFSGPDFVIFAELTTVPYRRRKVLTWLVYLAIGKGAVPHFINAMPYWVPYFSFARPDRGRHELATFPAERVCRKFGIDPSHLKTRKP